jgi:hypothetical protein
MLFEKENMRTTGQEDIRIRQSAEWIGTSDEN